MDEEEESSCVQGKASEEDWGVDILPSRHQLHVYGSHREYVLGGISRVCGTWGEGGDRPEDPALPFWLELLCKMIKVTDEQRDGVKLVKEPP